MSREDLFKFVQKEFGIVPDYPFDKMFQTAILRHKENRKWFGAVLSVEKNKLTGSSKEIVDILDVKCDPLLREPLLKKKGIYVAYHMNKSHWISIILNEADTQDVFTLLGISFTLTKIKTKQKQSACV